MNGRDVVGIVAMLVVGISAGQLAWALMPETSSITWLSVTSLGIVGSLVGGLFTDRLVENASTTLSYFHPMGVIGSMVGTLILVGLLHLVRRVSA